MHYRTQYAFSRNNQVSHLDFPLVDLSRHSAIY